MAIVVVVIPIAFRVPAVAVFVPPTMASSFQQCFPRFTQFWWRARFRLLALPTRDVARGKRVRFGCGAEELLNLFGFPGLGAEIARGVLARGKAPGFPV